MCPSKVPQGTQYACAHEHPKMRIWLGYPIWSEYFFEGKKGKSPAGCSAAAATACFPTSKT